MADEEVAGHDESGPDQEESKRFQFRISSLLLATAGVASLCAGIAGGRLVGGGVGSLAAVFLLLGSFFVWLGATNRPRVCWTSIGTGIGLLLLAAAIVSLCLP